MNMAELELSIPEYVSPVKPPRRKLTKADFIAFTSGDLSAFRPSERSIMRTALLCSRNDTLSAYNRYDDAQLAVQIELEYAAEKWLRKQKVDPTQEDGWSYYSNLRKIAQGKWKGLRVLDIGSGSSEPDDNYKVYPPLMAQYLATQGAMVIGIDIGPGFEDSYYRHITEDLSPFRNSHSLPETLRKHGIHTPFNLIYSRFMMSDFYGGNSPILGRDRWRVEDGDVSDRVNPTQIARIFQQESRSGQVREIGNIYRETIYDDAKELLAPGGAIIDCATLRPFISVSAALGTIYTTSIPDFRWKD